MYIAIYSSSKHSAIDDAHVTNSNKAIITHVKPSANIIIKACTLLDLVNRVASRKWIRLRVANISNDGLRRIVKVEMKMRMRQNLEQTDEGNITFNRTHRSWKFELATHIWIEMVKVERPRTGLKDRIGGDNGLTINTQRSKFFFRSWLVRRLGLCPIVSMPHCSLK